jgi:hypothetical protein
VEPVEKGSGFMKRQEKMGPEGPSEKNPMKGTGDSPSRNPADALTEQRQRKDMGPRSHEFDVGQFSGRGRPPLQKK